MPVCTQSRVASTPSDTGPLHQNGQNDSNQTEKSKKPEIIDK
jgi:hypothetical protein